MRSIDKLWIANFYTILSMLNALNDRRSAMRKSTMTLLTRAYFFLGALLVLTFTLTVGPYIAEQTVYIWSAFGAGLAMIAYGRTNIRRRWVSYLASTIGTVWIGALIFIIFGVASL